MNRYPFKAERGPQSPMNSRELSRSLNRKDLTVIDGTDNPAHRPPFVRSAITSPKMIEGP